MNALVCAQYSTNYMHFVSCYRKWRPCCCRSHDAAEQGGFSRRHQEIAAHGRRTTQEGQGILLRQDWQAKEEVCMQYSGVVINCTTNNTIYVHRARHVQREQEKLRSNLLKYNNFVREKESKVAEGERLFKQENDYQQSIQRLLSQKKEQMSRLDHAKVTNLSSLSKFDSNIIYNS